jgi:surfactin synthase thioesterase subunit
VTYQEALLWQRETTAPLAVRQFPGQHFFIFRYEREIMALIGQFLHGNAGPSAARRPHPEN